MALLPQAEGTVVRFLGGGFLIEQLHEPPPPPEVHSELVEKIAVHKRVLVGHWGEKQQMRTIWHPGHQTLQPENSSHQGQKDGRVGKCATPTLPQPHKNIQYK